MMKTCAVPDCDREAATRGWCVTHYSRWRRTGDVGSAEIAVKGVRSECTVDGCYRDATSRGMCGMHYLRVRRHGTIERRPHPRWASRDALTYDAAHDRVKRYRGRASDQACVDCGGQAVDWAYQHAAPAPLIDELGRPYSDNLDDYAPMCRGCHRALDMAVSRRQQGGDHVLIVTVEEAALYAGVSVTTVRSWVSRGALSPLRPNVKPLLYRYEDVARAQRDNRSRAWQERHAAAVERWLACV